MRESFKLTKDELVIKDEHAEPLARFQETVLNPAVNAALIEPWNALALSVNSASKAALKTELISPQEELKVAPAEFLSSSWFVESVSGGLAMLVPYTIAGRMGGETLRAAGARLNVQGEAARILQHGATGQILGAAVYDGLRQTRSGETHLGNAMGGAVAFTAMEVGNAFSKEMPLTRVLMVRALTGAIGATSQQLVSKGWSKGELPNKEELWKAGVGGMVINLVLPETQRALGTVVDHASVQMGLGAPVDRYIDRVLAGKSADEVSFPLAKLQNTFPWARVETGAESNDFNLAKQRILLETSKSGADKLARELSRMEQTQHLEDGFSQSAGLLNQGKTNDAWQIYRQLRLQQEAQAHQIENTVAFDLGKAKSVFSQAELAQEIGAWTAPGRVSQELRWRQEFTQFVESGGKYRPGTALGDVREYKPAKDEQEGIKDDPQTAREREIATDVVRSLQEDGHIAVFAGGSVRDEVMGRMPKDFDIASSATPDQVENLLKQKGFKVLTVGKQFGTIKAIFDGVQVEVTTLRNDGNYTDGRRPDSVEFASTLREDAARRDLTINAMFKDPITNTYYDLYNGRADIAAGKIRTVGDPTQRFAEDNLRMMRVPRFAARYGFTVDPGTFNAIRENAVNINKVSPERIREEMRGMLEAPKPSLGLDIMMNAGLMKEVIPEMIPMDGPKGAQDAYWHPEGTAWVHTKMVVDQLAANGNGKNFPLMMTGVLHDIAKPLTQEIKPNGSISNPKHESVGAEMAKDISERLMMTRHDVTLINKLVAQHMTMHHVKEMHPGRLAELLRKPEIHDLIEFQNADATGRGTINAGQDSNRSWLLAKLEELKVADDPNLRLDAKPLVDGHMVNSMGFPKLPIRSEILSRAREAQQEGLFSTPEEGRQWVLQNYSEHIVNGSSANPVDSK